MLWSNTIGSCSQVNGIRPLFDKGPLKKVRDKFVKGFPVSKSYKPFPDGSGRAHEIINVEDDGGLYRTLLAYSPTSMVDEKGALLGVSPDDMLKDDLLHKQFASLLSASMLVGNASNREFVGLEPTRLGSVKVQLSGTKMFRCLDLKMFVDARGDDLLGATPGRIFSAFQQQHNEEVTFNTL
jgi:hypothetical protein